jgi:putative restriction endonuclease
MALCRLHHWAFDNGWIAVDDQYRVLVRDAPEKDGYGEFTEYAGESLYIPDEPDMQPSLSFIRYHRKKHGFE